MPEPTPEVVDRWRAVWPEALRQWGPALRLQPPVLLLDPPREQADSLAWFDLQATTVTVNLREVARLGLLDQPLPVLAHEVGHHVLAPADRTTSARVVARCVAGLVDRPRLAGLVANLWTDTLVNDRLRRQRGLPMEAVYAALPPPTSRVFAVWMRAYELLWSLPRASIAGPEVTDEMDADALLLARHARAFAREPVAGAAGFAALVRRWLLDDDEEQQRPPAVCAGDEPGSGGTDPADGRGGVALDDSLADPVLHPALDPRVNPEAPAAPTAEPGDATTPAPPSGRPSPGQGFGPSRLTELYAALGSDRDAAVDWYVARAQPHLVPFPTRPRPDADEEDLQGWTDWELGEDLEDVDWLASSTRSPVIVPGRTTVQRQVDRSPHTTPVRRPVDLDLYVDSSGSMPDARRTVSPSVLAGTVLALSALRVGAAVQVTVWSGPGQVARTSGGFTHDRTEVVRALLHFWGGGTTFPLADLARDHPADDGGRHPTHRVAHLCVISDVGVLSMFGWGQREEDAHVAAAALRSAGGGGSLVLREPETVCEGVRRQAGDYRVFAVPSEDDLVPFAAAFARSRWGDGGTAAAPVASGRV